MPRVLCGEGIATSARVKGTMKLTMRKNAGTPHANGKEEASAWSGRLPAHEKHDHRHKGNSSEAVQTANPLQATVISG